MRTRTWHFLFLAVAVVVSGCGSGGDGGGSDPGSEAGDTGYDPGSLPKPDVADIPGFPDMAPLETAMENVSDSLDPADTAALSDLSCKEFYLQCVSQCPLDGEGLAEEACFEACRDTLSTEGEAELDTFLGCLETSGCDIEPDDAAKWNCYVEQCDDAYFGCFHGDEDCAAVLQCIQACPQGDGYGTCVVVCTQDGEADAQKQLVKILQCIGENCCPGDAAQCQTPEGQQCSKDVFQMGGACFLLGSACLMGTY